MKFLKKYEIFKYETNNSNIKRVFINGNYNNHLDINVKDSPELKYFFEWMELFGFTLDVRQTKFKWSVKIHATLIKVSYTALHYQVTIGEGNDLNEAIYQFIDKIKGKILIPDPHIHLFLIGLIKII